MSALTFNYTTYWNMFPSRQNWEMHPLWQPFSLANFESWCTFDHHQVSAHQQEHKAEGALKRPFLSSLVPLFQNESKCETYRLKMSPACRFIFMQIKVIFIRMVSHLDSLWNRGTRELGNGLTHQSLHLTGHCRYALHPGSTFHNKRCEEDVSTLLKRTTGLFKEKKHINGGVEART